MNSLDDGFNLPEQMVPKRSAHSAWTIIFSDLLALLLCFFILLYSITPVMPGNWQDLTRALKHQLNPEQSDEKTDGVLAQKKGVPSSYILHLLEEQQGHNLTLAQSQFMAHREDVLIDLPLRSIFDENGNMNADAQSALADLGAFLDRMGNDIQIRVGWALPDRPERAALKQWLRASHMITQVLQNEMDPKRLTPIAGLDVQTLLAIKAYEQSMGRRSEIRMHIMILGPGL